MPTHIYISQHANYERWLENMAEIICFKMNWSPDFVRNVQCDLIASVYFSGFLSLIFSSTPISKAVYWTDRPTNQKKNNDQKLCSWHLSQMFTIKAHRVKMMVGPRPWRIAEQYIWYCHSFHHIIRFCLQHNIIFQFNWIAKTARSICLDVLSFGLLCVYVLVFFSVLSSWREWVCVFCRVLQFYSALRCFRIRCGVA